MLLYLLCMDRITLTTGAGVLELSSERKWCTDWSTDPATGFRLFNAKYFPESKSLTLEKEDRHEYYWSESKNKWKKIRNGSDIARYHYDLRDMEEDEEIIIEWTKYFVPSFQRKVDW